MKQRDFPQALAMADASGVLSAHKVIASGITTGLGALFVILVRHWDRSKDAGISILRIANTPVVVPAWLATVLGILLLGSVSLAVRAVRKRGGDDQTIEPDAVPIVEATIVIPSFLGDASSGQGQRALTSARKHSRKHPMVRLIRTRPARRKT